MAFAFRGVSQGATDANITLEALWERIKTVPLSSYAAFVACFITQVVIRIERWRWQVRGLTGVKPGFADAWHINAASFAAVFFLPLRLGEFVRPNLCARRGIMSASSGLAASALERIIDGLVTAALFGGLLVAAPFELPAWVRAGGVSALFFFLGAVIFLVVAYRTRGPTTALLARIGNAISEPLTTRVLGLINGFLDGLGCFRGPKDTAVYVGLSVAFWLVNGIGTWSILHAVDDGATITAAYFCLCFLVIAVMLPAPPGNVGNFHAFASLGLTIAGIGQLSAITSAVLLHAVNTMSLVLIAAPSLFLMLLHRGDAPTPLPPRESA